MAGLKNIFKITIIGWQSTPIQEEAPKDKEGEGNPAVTNQNPILNLSLANRIRQRRRRILNCKTLNAQGL